MKRYYRQLITKDGLKGPLEEMKGKELTPEVKRMITEPLEVSFREPLDTAIHEALNAAIDFRTYRYRRQVECVVFEYEEE
jgi:hypothetical protein